MISGESELSDKTGRNHEVREGTGTKVRTGEDGRKKRVRKKEEKGKVNPNNEVSVSHQPAGDPRTDGRGRSAPKKRDNKKIKHWVSGDSGVLERKNGES
jgi:hypothetical protein